MNPKNLNPKNLSYGQKSRLLFRNSPGCFLTVHVKTQEFGEVEPNFNHEFYHQLPTTWYLIDDNLNVHEVGYNKNLEEPRITNGWRDLREFYGMIGDHNIYLGYLGDSIFKIIVFDQIVEPTSFPKFHTLRAQTEPLSFEVTLSKYSSTGSHLDLPQQFAGFLAETEYKSLYMYGPVPGRVKCKLLFGNPTNKNVKIGKGWKEFCKKNQFVAGKKLIFKFVYPTTNNIVDVKMVDK